MGDVDRERERDDAGDGKSTGVAMRWNAKGFGFIQPRLAGPGGGPGGQVDLFCHCSDILDGSSLREGGKAACRRHRPSHGRSGVGTAGPEGLD